MNSTVNGTWGVLNSTIEESLAPSLWASDDLILPNMSYSNFTNSTTHLDPANAANSVPVMWASAFLMVFCFSVCLRPGVPDEHAMAGIIRRREAALRDVAKKSVERRKKVVESSLITKRVISCDQNKTLQLGDVAGSVSVEESMNSLEDEHTSECVICLDVFRKGDYVTWSKSMECLHVFHQECLEHWLANPKHGDCPSCRCQIINTDKDSKETDIDDDIDDDMDQSSSSLAFVIMDGLISPLRRRCSLVGSSVNLDDGLSVSSQGGRSMRRVLSFGAETDTERPPSRLGIALRRVSSGIYSRLSGTFDEGDEEEHQPPSIQLSPYDLRRSKSEGLPVTPTIRNTTYHETGNGSSNCEPAPSFDLDSDSEEIDHAASRPRLMHLQLRPTSGAYSKLTSAFDNGCLMEDVSDLREDASDEEDSIGPRTLWRDEYLSEEEDDLEAGMD